MKRTGFARPQFERKPQPMYRLARPCAAAVISTTAAPVPKECAVRSETYRRLVAALPCIHCGIEGHSQHAHANMGKGAGLKVDDRRGFPLCCNRPGIVGCHQQLDQGALFDKATRRVMELLWVALTVARILASGKWPRNVEIFEMEELNA